MHTVVERRGPGSFRSSRTNRHSFEVVAPAQRRQVERGAESRTDDDRHESVHGRVCRVRQKDAFQDRT